MSQYLRCTRSCLLSISFFLIGSFHFPNALAQDASRVLLLHDFWEQDYWGKEIDRSFLTNLKRSLGAETKISAQYLGIQENQSPEFLQRQRRHIENMIQDQGVDLVVTVLPTAGDFYLEIGSWFDLPVIFLLPSFDSLPEGISTNPIAIVRSVWEESIKNTIEEMLKLRPRTRTIEIFAGNNDLDQVYIGRVKQVAEQFADRVQFSYQEGLEPDRFRAYVQQLSSDSLVLSLPYSAYNSDQKEGELSFMSDLLELSPVPVFGFSEAFLNSGSGIVGGNLSKTENYGEATAAIAYEILTGEPDYLSVAIVGTQSIFNWEQVQRWNLPLERLDTPYQLIFKPNSLWQEYPVVIVSVVNLILLLSGGLLFQSISLRQSKLAHARLEASDKRERESEVRYRLLADNSKDVIWTLNRATNSIDYCSPSIQSLTGYTPEEFMVKDLSQVMTPTSAELVHEAISKNTLEPVVLEVEQYTKDGGTVWCEIVAQALPADSGSPFDLVGVTRDISQRKAADAERRQLEDQMRQAQKIETIGTFAGGIAHDFNNILGVITGITDLLKVDFVGDSRASKLLNSLMTASEKGKKLVRQILTFSRQSSGEKEVLNLSSLVQESLGILEAGFSKKVILKKNIATHPLRIMANPTQIEQVIINVITNANEANEGDGGNITVTTSFCQYSERRELKYGKLEAGNYAVLKVKDDGIGMTDDHLEKIFEPFFTSKELGNGIGLAIVLGIVTEHQGAIDIESELGKGTTVTIFLPLTHKIEATKNFSEDTHKSHTDSRRILLIDDQEDLLEIMSLMLNHLGHECVRFSDSTQAMRVLKQEGQDFDLIITDYSMPNITGIEIIKYCAENYPSLPVILSTGYNDNIVDQSVLEQDYFSVLNKPFNFEELRQALDQSL